MTTSDRPLRLGTRASPLAMAQAHMVRDALLSAHGWGADRVEIIPFTASGDRILDRALAEVGGKALWTKELDRALVDGVIDFAVHSMKDVETLRPPEISLVAMLLRADVRDRLIGAESLAALKPGAIVGTSAPRRTAQVLRARPDVKVVLFRGNVATRLAKLAAGVADVGMGIEMAARARGLDFVPLVHERYHLACLKSMLEQPATLALRNLLQTSTWQNQMANLPGYAPMHCGEVLAMSQVLPWWKFSRKKRDPKSKQKP